MAHPQRSHCPDITGTNKTMNSLTSENPPSIFQYISSTALPDQFSSGAQSCPTLRDPMNCSLAGYSSWGHKESDTTE